MKKVLADFCGVYPVSQTLKFELRPQGKTEENLKISGLLESDIRRASDYPKVKAFLDEKHKQFLQKTLSGINDIDWKPLADALDAFQVDNSQRKELEAKQGEFRRLIIAHIAADEEYSYLVSEKTPSKLFKSEIEKNPDALDEVKTFARFACYFKGYQENRANIYSVEAQQTSAAYRAVNDNFTKFATAAKIFHTRIATCEELMHELEAHSDLTVQNISKMFSIPSYNRFLSQSGIDQFNEVVAAINYVVNQYRQQHPEFSSRELPFLPPLFKQILSDRESTFKTGEFETDADVCEALRDFVAKNRKRNIHGKEVDLFLSLRGVFATLKSSDNLFVDASELDRISQNIFGRWDALRDLKEKYAAKIFSAKGKREKYCKDAVNFSDLNAWFAQEAEVEVLPVRWLDFWQGKDAGDLFDEERKLRNQLESIIAQQDATPLRERQADVSVIKNYLDTIQNLLHILKPLVVGSEYGGDLDLQGIIQEHYAALAEVIPLYNRTRNYMTKKITETGKIKLMFDNPTLAAGWDANKELANTAVLFIRDGAYYLGIMNPKSKTDFTKFTASASGPFYRKMEYRQVTDPSQDLPNLMRIDGVVVRKTGRKDKKTGENKILENLRNTYLPSEVNRIRKEGTFKETNDLFSKNDLCAYIDFYKEMITEYKSDLHFNFKSSCEYKNWNAFLNDVKFQAYQVSFTDIPVATVEKLVDEGKLFLFQIWSKDFAPGAANGTPNKATLYWRALFDPRNLADVVFKLNGEAELFYREPAVDKPIVHKKGEKLVNRTIVTEICNGQAVRTPIDEKIYYEIFRYVNGRLDEPLSDDAAGLLKKRLDWMPGMRFEDTCDRLVVKDAKIDMVKDKRFTERKYLFHVPITINFKAPGSAKFNDAVKEFLRANSDVKIIGIDRGERNLIYIVLMDQRGNVIAQRNFNIVGGVDYQAKLNVKERERDFARKSWREIGKIKDLKAGYLSGVVHEIAKLMVDNNAIVVMEDLNGGFKRGRTKIERQVYQKFERALIEKLNYLVFKKADPTMPGGVLKGYQLTDSFESFSKMGKQSGFIFYVPAWCTSKIDPITGFVDFFGSKFLRYESAAKSRNFFAKFAAIRYLAKEGIFEFAFDYKKFTDKCEGSKTVWQVCSFGDRLEKFKDQGYWNVRRIDVSAELKTLFAASGITLEGDLLPQILNQSESQTEFWRDLHRLFQLTMQMRNSRPNSTASEDDYIISPVRDQNGKFFDSRHALPGQPGDADANGAYNIARKGILLVEKIRQNQDGKISPKDWLQFAQKA